MLLTAAARGFQPLLVAFDSWYSSLENLKSALSIVLQQRNAIISAWLCALFFALKVIDCEPVFLGSKLKVS